MRQELEIVRGKVTTKQASNEEGYSVCKFSLDFNVEVKTGKPNIRYRGINLCIS